MNGYERIGPPPVVWGSTLCSRRQCTEDAEVLLDGWPLCIDCAEAELDRWVAFSLNPELARMMPSLADR